VPDAADLDAIDEKVDVIADDSMTKYSIVVKQKLKEKKR